jgi:hypothetical protein
MMDQEIAKHFARLEALIEALYVYLQTDVVGTDEVANLEGLTSKIAKFQRPTPLPTRITNHDREKIEILGNRLFDLEARVLILEKERQQ